MLSDSESESDDGPDPLHQITINEHYAKAFEYKKEREELQRLKEQYGSDPDSSEEEETDSEDLESEDSDGEELTPAMDAAILRTLARIKRKDPGIYEEGKNIFGEEQEKTTQSARVALTRPTGPAKEHKNKSKPFTMRDANLQSALLSRSPSPDGAEPPPVTHVEEQRRLRDETIAAFHAAAEEEADDFLVPREKTLEETAREEAEYRQFLEKEVGDVRELVDIGGGTTVQSQEDDGEEGSKEKKKKKKKKDKEKGGEEGTSRTSKQEEDQEFLVNYILNRGWIDRSSKRVPTYGEVTSQSKKGKAKAQPTDDAEDPGQDASAEETDEEEVFDDIVDRFESSYNFRFEENDGSEIKAYPRNLPSLVRREDTTRKDARERRKQRKEEELAKRKEEVRRLKGLKVKEIRARLERAGVATGEAQTLEELGIDLDAPWDPEAHDRQMAGLYALNGGEEEEGAEFEDDTEKPTWGEDVDIGDIRMSPEASTSKAEKKKKKKKKKKGEEDDDEGVDVDAMDADAIPAPGGDDEEWDGTEEMRKRKLDEWMDEVYALDFNDLVGGMPTRFHYASVAPQNFALTPVEILLAKDSELNEYMSVKKYAPYRADNKAGWDHTRTERLRELKGKVKERMGGMDVEQPGRDGQAKKKRKGKKERMKDKGVVDAAGASDTATLQMNGAEDLGLKRKHPEDEEPAGDPGQPSEGGKKKRRRKKKDTAIETEAD
ncbi:KRI1-like family C-terminal-domain-containing protein [Mycena alexandri]|uniref:KRI1-like family C-terminal-domain-containing protein n=1 Tax=Mycena alexandri TaxID=1745969 RepID=A0AAD6SRI6_9AGAR|nr:KRI1-like family C-terminal-domain-containing protein [Mycena alexandri]